MLDYNNNNIYAKTNTDLFKTIGAFVKQTRLDKNLSQEELATKAGLNRATVSLFESGTKGNMDTFIRVLRAIDKLQFFEQFEPRFNIDPLVNIERQGKQQQRKRAKKR